MKTAILCFPILSWDQIQMPIGLYKIKTFCKEAYNIKIIDARIENAKDAIQKIIDTEDVLCLGLSVMTGTQIKNAIEISKIYHGEVPIVWGGMHPTILPNETLQNSFIDYIICGDGEERFYELLKILDNNNKQLMSSFNKIELGKFSQNSCFDLNKSHINFLNDDIPQEYFIKRDGFNSAISIETSRGCPSKCGFCHNTINSSNYRIVDTSTVIKGIENLYTEYKIDGIIFQEDNFFVDKKRAFDIIKWIETFGEIGWKANGRVNHLKKFIEDDASLKTLLNSNCKVLQFGIESGSDRVLKYINKNIVITDVIKLNAELANYKINIRYNFIIGFPTETIKEIQQTERLIERLLNDNPNVEPPFVNIYTPYPGTPLFEEALRDGFIPPTTVEDWSNIFWNATSNSWPRKTNDYIHEVSNGYLTKSKYLK